jgi:methionyl-tRNA formyltransferase
MNIVFIGASRFSLKCLELAYRTPGCAVTGVVTAPQNFTISYRPDGVSNVLYANVAKFAADRGLPCRTLLRSMADASLLDAVVAWKPDAFLVAGWYHMLPKVWRDLAPAYGLHASLLPDYSGGAPLVWAMINGETKTGITMFQMDDGVDSGPIVDQAEETIYPDDTIATLYARIEDRGLELLSRALPRLADGSAKVVPQPRQGRRVMPQRSPENGRIDWRWDPARITRFIRAQTFPYPGAFDMLEGEPIHFWQAKVDPELKTQIEPGLVCRRSDGGYSVDCNGGAIIIGMASRANKNYEAEQLVELFGAGGQCFDVLGGGLRHDQ